MFANIPQSRLLLYAMLLGLVPLLLAVGNFMHQQNKISTVENQLLLIGDTAATQKKRQAVNIAVRNNFRDADHFYIDKHLETIDFLEPEVESLQKVLDNKNFADDENIKKRLDFLTSPQNDLIFTEGVVQSTPIFQETTETLVHPVEVNVDDIRSLLAKIEGIEIGKEGPNPNRPELIILDFKIEKKRVTEKNEVFLLNLKLLKREFL
jgi:hypothetical protein